MGAVLTYLSDAARYIGALFSTISFTDIIDIIILSVLLYYVYRFVRERRAGKLALGIVLLIVAFLLSDIFGMHAINFILQNVFQAGIIALLILFQPELRSALEKVGGEPLRGLKNIGADKNAALITGAIDEICVAADKLSLERTGALIVLERTTMLGDIVKSGIEIDAATNSFMLRNLFFDKAPLHDGAVIVRKWRLCAAGCFLPLSASDKVPKRKGTRHRAALGMSEVSDAVVVVVSEETGEISIAEDGVLTGGYNYSSLKQRLMKAFSGDIEKGTRRAKRKKIDDGREAAK